jgi:hypothetical protein
MSVTIPPSAKIRPQQFQKLYILIVHITLGTRSLNLFWSRSRYGGFALVWLAFADGKCCLTFWMHRGRNGGLPKGAMYRQFHLHSSSIIYPSTCLFIFLLLFPVFMKEIYVWFYALTLVPNKVNWSSSMLACIYTIYIPDHQMSHIFSCT